MSFGEGCGGTGGRGAGFAKTAGLPDGAETHRKRLKGAIAYYGGKAAEDQVEAAYLRAGLTVAARRWRGTAGEIDLVLRNGAELVFVEVKRADTHAIAAERVSDRQVLRILAAASEYVAAEPAGQDSPMRFDVALVDAQGRIEIVTNALGP